MATVIERNFFRLLRAGLFSSREAIEPLSPWKWRRLYQLSLVHGVSETIWHGIQVCQDDYFVGLISPELKEKWSKTVVKTKEPDEDTEEAMGLTNPLLDRKLQAIIDQESSLEETPTRLLLVAIVNNTRAILNEGINLPLLMEMARMLRQPAGTIDFEKLQSWISRLRLQPMADLLGTLNVMLLGFREAEVPFMKKNLEKTATQLTEELFNLNDGSTDEWYFTQKDDEIFVRTHNSRAMFWHVGHSARFSRLYPSEALTNFFKSFANSLTHIEE